MKNHMRIVFPSLSENERLARTVCAAFVLQIDPTVEEISELKTAISEAVTNSIIHGYRNGTGDIEIAAQLNDRTVTYRISDNGCGIEDIERAREPLYTGTPGAERSGMGFSIMEAFMDRLTVESEVGKGTTVIMSKRFGDDDGE